MASQSNDVMDKAFEGKVSLIDFKTFVSNYIKDANDRVAAKIEVEIPKVHLDFNISNGLFPVSDLKDDKQDNWRLDTVTITNLSKKNKIYYCFDVHKNPKYELQVDAPSGVIKAKATIQIHLRARIFCTTRIYQVGRIFFYEKDPAKTSKYFYPMRSPKNASKDDHLDLPPFQYISFRLESELSPSLDYDDIEFGRQLAKGGYGTVYLAKWRGAEVAVKVLNSQEMVEEEKELVQREITLMSKLNYAHIVTYMGSTKIPNQPLCIVMEYISEGSLKGLLKKNLDFTFKSKLALDIAKGLLFLHTNSICHRDIKPDNVLVISTHKDSNVNVKLTDFGTSRTDAAYKQLSGLNDKLNQLALNHEKEKRASNKGISVPATDDTTKRNLTKGVGTLIYSAPEILNGSSNYDAQKADIYSYGILLWELFSQKEPFSEPPYDKYSNTEIAMFVIQGKRLEIPKDVHPEVVALIKACWAQEPDKRPPCAEIIKVLEKVMKEVPEPYPKDIHQQVGWHGEIDRETSEEMLRGCARGTFLVRYSKNQTSFVLSHKDDSKEAKKGITHISGISQSKVDGKVTVTTTRGHIMYDTFMDYINTMIKNKVITVPLVKQEGNYGVTDLYDKYNPDDKR